MIPKIIHYCWFGRGRMPSLALRCIASWKLYLPDYELILWNEDNFDINSHPYVKEAYEAKKYAFVTDYVRLKILYDYGGIYMDTDVEVIRNLDDLLSLPAFSGFESEVDVPTGIMGSEKSGEWVQEQLLGYDKRHFLKPGGSLDLTTNTQAISGIMAKNGFILKNSYQVYKSCMHIFPKEYFCPKSRSGIITITEHTYCIHHFAASWDSVQGKIKRLVLHKLLGPYIVDSLIKRKRIIKDKFRRLK